jgi:hypothetical protein
MRGRGSLLRVCGVLAAAIGCCSILGAAAGAMPVDQSTGSAGVQALSAGLLARGYQHGTRSQPSPSVVLAGGRVIRSSRDANDSGTAQAFPLSTRTTGTISSIEVYVDPTNEAAKLVAGLYSDKDGHPDSLLSSGALAKPHPGGWNTLAVPSAAVQSGSRYWLAVLGTGGTLVLRASGPGSCASETSQQSNLTGLPASWADGSQRRLCPISAYASGPRQPTDSTPVSTTPISTGTTAAPPAGIVSTSTTSTPPLTLPTPPPVSQTSPAISGTPQAGQKLSTSTGSWLNDPTAYSYQWEDCDSVGIACSAVSGATGSSYTLTSGDVGHTVRSVVTATNSGGSASASSAATAVVSASVSPPSSSGSPVVSGTAEQGQVLSTTNGSWSGSPTSYGYGWEDCNSSGGSCSAISGATGSSYTLTSGDVGHTVRSVVTATNSGGSASASSAATAVVSASSSSPFPLKVSGNGRYLETASGAPWLMVGDSPQSVIGDLSTSSASQYFADRESHGFSAIWINLLCDSYTECASDGDTYDGIAPFTSGTDPSSYNLADPNSSYFQRAYSIVQEAEADDQEILLDPIETGGCESGGWISTLENNGNGTVNTTSADYAYGQYIGNYFKSLPNIIWAFGNDFQCYTYGGNDADLYDVDQGILSTDPGALTTMELNFCNDGGYTCIGSSSDDDTEDSWNFSLNAAYTYSPTYAEVLHAYNQTPTIPAFLVESNYEGQDNPYTDGGSTQNLRLQEWWTMTSGAAGQMYGGPSYGIANGFSDSTIDTVGVQQLEYQTNLLDSLGEWYNLAPDQSHQLVTAGYGTCPTTGSEDGVNCVTDAETSDHTLALAYLPEGGTITVNMAQMAGATTVRWFDPTDGDFTSISGSPFANSGSHSFTPPGTNSGGDSDWVLVFQAT